MAARKQTAAPQHEKDAMTLIHYYQLNNHERPFGRMLNELPYASAEAIMRHLAARLGFEVTKIEAYDE